MAYVPVQYPSVYLACCAMRAYLMRECIPPEHHADAPDVEKTYDCIVKNMPPENLVPLDTQLGELTVAQFAVTIPDEDCAAEVGEEIAFFLEALSLGRWS